MKRTCEILAAVALMLIAVSDVYAGGPVACGHGTVSWSPDKLWPPDHKLQTINITYTQPCDDSGATGGCAGGDFSITVTNITSSEEPLPRGCGQPNPQQGPDFNGLANQGLVSGTEPISVATTLPVRAERCGNGSGRVYTIDVTCIEHGEQPDTATLTVNVPHDLGQ